jgi:hypothetical protein
LIVAVGLLSGFVFLWGNEWELVYPASPQPAQDLPLLSLGKKTNSSHYMLGSRSGYVIEQFWSPMWGDTPFTFSWEHAQVRKLPFSFDITAIGNFKNQWIIGGSEGQFALNSVEGHEGFPGPPGYEPLPPVEEVWISSRIPVSEPIQYLGAIHGSDDTPGDRIVARTNKQVFISDNNGQSWIKANLPLQMSDFIVFKGDAYAIGTNLVDNGSTHNNEQDLVLYRSRNGMDWSLVWNIFVEGGSYPEGRLSMLSDSFKANGEAWFENSRLYVDGSIQVGFGHPNVYSLQISSFDGETWLDHDSVYVGYCPNLYCGGRNPWNPLNIPEHLRYLDSPDIFPTVDYNYTLHFNKIFYYSNHDWIDGMKTEPLVYDDYFSKSKSTSWDGIAAVYAEDRIITFLAGQTTEFNLPELEFTLFRWKQLINAGGIYYLTAQVQGAQTDDILFASEDLNKWEQIPLPEYAESIEVLSKGNHLAAHFDIHEPNALPIDSLAYWDGEWSEPVLLPDDTGPLVYIPSTQTWYRLVVKLFNSAENVVVERMTSDGSFEPFVSYKSDAWPGYLRRMECPDGENLIVYGDSAELLFIKPDGSLHHTHPWRLFPEAGYFVNAVHFINGWYYLGGGVNLRTKDFIDFETVPFGSPMDNILDDGDALYAFIGDAVYKQDLERGYLSSIEDKQAWRRSDWLGWFLIQNEEAGDIDHLLLGKCWVKQTSELEYWIRTEALGWIWMRKDWAPWLYRLDDGHWYWLDQDGWPPRAWADADGEWEELLP